jgi:hypothetical protein
MRHISAAPNIAVTIGGQLRIYYAYVTSADPALDGVAGPISEARTAISGPRYRGSNPRLPATKNPF